MTCFGSSKRTLEPSKTKYPLGKHLNNLTPYKIIPRCGVGAHTKGDTSDISSMQPTEHPRTFPPGSTGSGNMRPYPSCLCLPEFSFSRATATGALEASENLSRLRSWGRRSDSSVSYCTDQLLILNFSGGNTLNGTYGGNRWARVLCGQISWLSEPLHRDDRDCSGCTNLKMWFPEKHGKKKRPTQNTPRNPQQPGDHDQLVIARDATRSTR